MTKRLYKSTEDKQIDGVCAGIAEYFEVDPTLIRITFAMITIVTGIFPGLFAYLILAIIIPKKSKEKKNGKKVSKA